MTGPRAHGIWVYLELVEGAIAPVGLELLGRGRHIADELDEPLVAVLLGSDLDALARQAISHGADDVLLADHPLLANYSTDGHAKVLGEMARNRHPNALLVGSTPNGRDLAGRLAVRLDTGLTANAVRLDADPQTGLVLGAVPGFGGSVLAVIKTETQRPQMVTVRPGTFAPLAVDPERTGRVESVPVHLAAADIRTQVLERKMSRGGDITGAERVVVAGLGFEGDVALANELAKAIDGAVGVTRPLVDMGLATREQQIGSTGLSLRAKVAVVAGASGASHFVSGIKDVDTVIAINKDPDAEIFKVADLCIVGEIQEILPKVLAALTGASVEVVA